MNVPKLLKQAEKLISYGKVNEAINLYQDILSEDFHNTAVHNLIADLYISKQDIQRASRHLFKIAADYTAQGDQTAAVTGRRQTSVLASPATPAPEYPGAGEITGNLF